RAAAINLTAEPSRGGEGGGGVGGRADKLPRRLINKAIRAIRDTQGHHREFHWPAGLTLHVDRNTVRLERASHPESSPES
ncbi:MAG: hypothetical protein VYC34_11510, partial [Planctomycetota bacterium]|nr:hypothetical protein [Planctomycetota bacterium]